MKVEILVIISTGIWLVFCTGCANYAGIHAQSNPIQLPYVDSKNLLQGNWWEIFHDPALDQYIKLGLCESPSIKIAQARLRMAESMAQEANANLWPSLQNKNIIVREHFTQNTIIPPPFAGHTENIGLLFLLFKYDFDFWGKNRNLWATAISDTQAECAEIAAARLILTTAIATTYFELQNNLIQLNLNKRLLNRYQRLLQIAQTRSVNGIESDIFLNQANTNMHAILIKYNHLEAVTEVTRHQLIALLGQCSDSIKITPKPFNHCTHTRTFPKAISIHLLARRPDLMVLRWRIESAMHNVDATKAAFYPDINLIANASLQSIGLGKLLTARSQDMNLGPKLGLPIFDAGRLRAILGAKYAAYDVMVEQYNQAVINAIREAADQLSTLKAAILQLKAQSTSLEATQKNYYLTSQCYQNGVIDYASLLRAEETLLQQKLAQIQTQTNYLQAVIDTIKALGGSYSTAAV